MTDSRLVENDEVNPLLPWLTKKSVDADPFVKLVAPALPGAVRCLINTWEDIKKFADYTETKLDVLDHEIKWNNLKPNGDRKMVSVLAAIHVLQVLGIKPVELVSFIELYGERQNFDVKKDCFTDELIRQTTYLFMIEPQCNFGLRKEWDITTYYLWYTVRTQEEYYTYQRAGITDEELASMIKSDTVLEYKNAQIMAELKIDKN